MKLLKVNLIFIPLLALCLGAVGYAARKMLLEDARQHVLQNARLLMETALSSRKYTIKYITPFCNTITMRRLDSRNSENRLKKSRRRLARRLQITFLEA